MKKLLISSLLSFVLLFLAAVSARALSLDYIGGLSTEGKSYSHWYYTNLQPRLGGTADVGKQVSLTVGDQTGDVSVDADGNWWWDPSTAFTAGDYAAAIGDGVSTLSFTLTLGSTVPGSTGSATTVSGAPATGWTQLSWAVLFLAAAGSFAGAFVLARQGSGRLGR